MRVRLREAYPDPAEFYASRYPDGYNHTVWPDHVERVEATVQFARGCLHPETSCIVDLTAGDAAIPNGIADLLPSRPRVYLSDYRHRDGYDDSGPAELTVQDMPYADLFVCSETLEHLDNPDAFLKDVRPRAATLLVTTPLGETDPLQNPEHYWGWDDNGVLEMLLATGWSPIGKGLFTPSCGPYTFQMWAAT